MSREVFPGVTVDPEVSFGRPTVKGRGISCEALASRFVGGESIHSLSLDYGLAPVQIEAALRWSLLSPSTRRRRLA